MFGNWKAMERKQILQIIHCYEKLKFLLVSFSSVWKDEEHNQKMVFKFQVCPLRTLRSIDLVHRSIEAGAIHDRFHQLLRHTMIDDLYINGRTVQLYITYEISYH